MRNFFRKILLWINIGFIIGLILAYLANHISPAHVWVLAFFGLAYPFLLVINIFFILFWWWWRRWYAFLSLAVILLGWNNLGRYMQIPNRQDNPQGQEVSLMSFNVRLFNFYAWEKNTSMGDSIFQFVIRKSPDIVCFQEFVTRDTEEKLDEAYIDQKLAILPYTHQNFTHQAGRYGNYGLATYSKYPIVNKGRIPFFQSFNSCIFSDIVVGMDTVRVFNVHLQSINLRKNNYKVLDNPAEGLNQKNFDEVRDISGRLKDAFIKRAIQVDELRQAIEQSPYPVVVCGDFNDTPVSYTYQRVKGDLRDAFIRSGAGTGSTYRGNFPSFRIDYIFHSKDIQSANFQSEHLSLSDHFPVSCDLYLQ